MTPHKTSDPANIYLFKVNYRTVEEGVKYVQSYQQNTGTKPQENTRIEV